MYLKVQNNKKQISHKHVYMCIMATQVITKIATFVLPVHGYTCYSQIYNICIMYAWLHRL